MPRSANMQTRLQQVLVGLDKKERLWLFVLTSVLVFVVTWGIVLRYAPTEVVGNMTAPVEELSKLILVWLVFWGASRVQREDGHYKMPIFLNLLGRRTRLVFLILGNLAIIGFLLLMVMHTFPVLKSNTDTRSMVMLWPRNLWIYGYLVGVGLMLLYTVYRVILDIRSVLRACQH